MLYGKVKTINLNLVNDAKRQLVQSTIRDLNSKTNCSFACHNHSYTIEHLNGCQNSVETAQKHNKWYYNPVLETIAEKVQLPKLIWNEYSLCVNFDKESKQLEMAIKFIQNAKSLASLKKMVTSSNGDFLSKVRGHN